MIHRCKYTISIALATLQQSRVLTSPCALWLCCTVAAYIQGGDPTGTGLGGESIYGPTFKDEIDGRLLHSGRGVLSMANSGPATNGSQFFILYKSAAHLNYKHTVFGRVVGGLDVLSLMEKVTTDDEDRPLQVGQGGQRQWAGRQ